jgi:alkylated DNA nucleotide flippase Atl1
MPRREPIADSLRRELSRDGRWPDDDQVQEKIATVDFYLHGRAHQQRAILQQLESRLRAEIDVDFDSAALSIEHIMPQALSKEWKAQLTDAGHDPQAVFERFGHNLGNLTLTAWNSEMSNQLFQRKQEILSGSELKLNERLLDVTEWGPTQIVERGQFLAETASARWSPPIPGVITPYTGFDWTSVDQAVDALPMGSWTSYGDLAELAGTAAQPTAYHVAHEPSLNFAYRVLSSDGSVSADFKWADPADVRDPVEVLIGEGIEFDETACASQAQRLGPSELEALLDPNQQPTLPS